MIFYNEEFPNSTVTSKKNNKRICEFKDGKFETENKIIIKKLRSRFRYKRSPKVMSGLAGFLKLKEKAIEKGVYKKGMKKKDLIKVLEEVKK
ncbi:hypothetical protein KAX08_05725 [candidate division WOR-3 bacterium]|nr:hypothetical protein [candidate division WOR-3 bacterium]